MFLWRETVSFKINAVDDDLICLQLPINRHLPFDLRPKNHATRFDSYR